jgi:hypothetical protein
MKATLLGPLISAATALVVVLIGAVAVPIVRERRALNRDARYLAIRIVCILDRYVEDCASTAIDSGEEDNQGVSTPRVKAPPPPVYPSDVNWKSIEHSMMYTLLSLPASAASAANYVGAWDPVSHMKDQLKQIAARQAQRQAACEENLPPGIPPASKDPA